MTKESHSSHSQDAKHKQGNNPVPDNVKPRVEDKGKEIQQENSHFTNRAPKSGQ